MHPYKIIQQLYDNQFVFRSLLSNRSSEEVKWKPTQQQWCILEVVCHLVDEEREDFRTRVEYVLRDPTEPLPMFDPLNCLIKQRAMCHFKC